MQRAATYSVVGIVTMLVSLSFGGPTSVYGDEAARQTAATSWQYGWRWDRDAGEFVLAPLSKNPSAQIPSPAPAGASTSQTELRPWGSFLARPANWPPIIPETKTGRFRSSCPNDWHVKPGTRGNEWWLSTTYGDGPYRGGGYWDGDGTGTVCQCAFYNLARYSPDQSKSSCQPPWGYDTQPPIPTSRLFEAAQHFRVNPQAGDFMAGFQPSLERVPSQIVGRACEDGFLPPTPPKLGSGYWLADSMTNRAPNAMGNGITVEFTPGGKQHRSFCFEVPPGTNMIRTTPKDLSVTCHGNFRHTLYRLRDPQFNRVADGIHTGNTIGHFTHDVPPGIYVWDMAVAGSDFYSASGWMCRGIQSLIVTISDAPQF
ncbi:MAG: hypothetical protein COV75_08175 [Candidatus Omnitrophica bacterium CG11_big_fil_rev_8_21_14_0_20_63_9]|nr:MAG: hypothetical protein COV75_08175 [Candidatus Omnitrophica bacterium CG11_big_fil_rev_8_21_14_0_20_63_9]